MYKLLCLYYWYVALGKPEVTHIVIVCKMMDNDCTDLTQIHFLRKDVKYSVTFVLEFRNNIQGCYL
jgi:hypothetical protein